MSKFVLGITGGVGSGKSTVLDYLQREHGALVIQADLVARELMEPGQSCYLAVVEEFGQEILTGPEAPIDRVRLAQIVFNDDQKLARLNAMTHPLVKEEVQRRISEAKESLIVYEAALPREADLQGLCQQVWFVHVPVEIRIQRLMASRGYSEEKCRSIMANQYSDQAFAAVADHVIENGGSTEETEKQLQKLLADVI